MVYPSGENRESESYEEFLTLFTRDRDRLFAYIFSMIPNAADAEDLFQRCSAVLWRKFGDFRPEQAKFLTWACGVAYNEVRNFLRTSSRDRLHFDDELVQQMAEHRDSSLREYDDQLIALRNCLTKLKVDQRRLIDTMYGDEGTVKRLAEETGAAVQTLYNQLRELRQKLLACVQKRIATSG